jgi:hypothetical protein
MFHPVERLDCWLRNKLYPEPEFTTLHSIDELFDRDDPWQTRIYWAVRRSVKHSWDFPGDTYRSIKWFIQRGRRGWADCDGWSLDYYLDGWLPAALKQLKENKHGTPMSVFPTEPAALFVDEIGNPTEAASKIAIRRWDNILKQIIAGFESSRRITSGLYEEELGPYPGRRPVGLSRDAWEKIQDQRFKESQKLSQRDQKIFENGMRLFAKHYNSLWD